jgi:1-acyl-sn-glycerol-3-phosphate acyltransferase
MIKTKHTIYPIFKCLTRFLIKRYFHTVYLDGDFDDQGKPILVIANHASWWDGFWIEYLNQQRLHRTLHFMMLEEQLRKHWYFQYTGGYSVRKRSRDLLQSLDYTMDLLQHKDNVVLVFPEGEIHSAYIDQVHFQNGIQHIVNRCQDDVQLLFVANLTDYFSEIKPSLFIYFRTYRVGDLKNKSLETAYNLFFTDCVHRQKIKTA